MQETEGQKTRLSVASIIILNIATVMSLKGLPLIASTGATMIFYLLFSTLLFLIPCALVAAELVTGWPQEGGVYLWVKEAFGPNTGLIAMWLQWMQNVIWVPTALAFAVDSFAYSLGKPSLGANNVYTSLMIIGIYWGAIFITLNGLKVASFITSVGVTIGTVIPGIFVISLGVIWVVSGNPINLEFSSAQMLPDFSKFTNIAFLAGIVLLFAGMEVSAVHARFLKDPKEEYPKALLYSVILIVGIFLFGSLSIAFIVPQKQIGLTVGVMEVFSRVLDQYNLYWLVRLLGFCITIGVIAGVIAWICGPSRGLLFIAKEGRIPAFMAHVNKKGMPSAILIMQGIIVTALTCINLFAFKNVDVVYFLLTAMTSTLYVSMYILMFAAALKLRYSQPNVERKYRVPGGLLGMWVISGIGISASFFAFILGFMPPAELGIASPWLYVGLLAAAVVVLGGMPFIMRFVSKAR